MDFNMNRYIPAPEIGVIYVPDAEIAAERRRAKKLTGQWEHVRPSSDLRKPSRSYAPDWEELGNGLSYSKREGLYYKKGRHYDDTSARHNGIIGTGAQLTAVIINAAHGG